MGGGSSIDLEGGYMQTDDKLNRREPESLAPIQLERLSVDDDVAQMKRGKGLRLTVTVLVSLIAITAGARLLGRIDQTQAYATAAERLETIDNQRSEAFLRCALPNVQPTQLASASELHTAIEIATERLDKRYGTQIAQCTHLLADLQQSLSALEAPSDMTRRLEGLRAAAGELSQAWTAYRGYLQDPRKPYDYVQAVPMIEKITNAWTNYRGQLNDTKAALRAHG
jgi:hypothetical protein